MKLQSLFILAYLYNAFQKIKIIKLKLMNTFKYKFIILYHKIFNYSDL